MPRYFTRDEAEHVLPQVEQLLREALYLKQQYVEADEALKTKTREITMSGGMAVDSQAMLLVQRRRDSAAERLPAVMEGIQEHGCVVKDLDTGLLDFPTLYEGREVYLCWRLGEPRIGFWHAVEEGFRGRKPIDAAFLGKHRGGSAEV
jgi:hypothetical protein